MGLENVQHLPGAWPNRPSPSVACTVGPALDTEPHKPPQTPSQTGAVKFPHTMPRHMHTPIHNHVNFWS